MPDAGFGAGSGLRTGGRGMTGREITSSPKKKKSVTVNSYVQPAAVFDNNLQNVVPLGGSQIDVGGGIILTFAAGASATLTVPKTGTALLGSGTTAYIPQFSDANTLGNSNLKMTGSSVLTLTASTVATLTVPSTGTVMLTGDMGKAPQGTIYNGKIAPSVASNNLTLALKTLAGTDPSATDPVYARIGDTVYTIAAALSVTKNAATNWCNAGSAELATKEIDYFVYLGYNATDGVVIGFSRIPFANCYSDFSATTTNEKFCAISNIAHAAATDYYEVIGRFAATLSAGAGYTWSVPTFTAINLIQRPIYETRYLSYTPTGISATNISLSGGYIVQGRRCFVDIRGVFTGAITYTTSPTLPLSVSSSLIGMGATLSVYGNASYYDVGTSSNPNGLIPGVLAGSNVINLMISTGANMSASSPITWTNNDQLDAHINYLL